MSKNDAPRTAVEFDPRHPVLVLPVQRADEPEQEAAA